MLPLALRLRVTALARPSALATSSSAAGRLASRDRRPGSLPPPAVALRALSTTAARQAKLPAHKKKRIIPQRMITVPQTVPRQKSDEELEDEDITRQLRQQAGHNLKTAFKGVKQQERYFDDALRRQDKELLTAAMTDGLPELTDDQIDDFYTNLMASGTTLGNLPDVASPTHAPAARAPEAATVTADEFARLPRAQKEEVADERLRLLRAVELRDARRAELLGALGVPRVALNPADDGGEAIAGPEEDSEVRVGEEVELETVGVAAGSERAQTHARELEVGPDGEAAPVVDGNSGGSSGGSPAGGPSWAGSAQGLRYALPPRQSSSAAGASVVERSTSQAAADALLRSPGPVQASHDLALSTDAPVASRSASQTAAEALLRSLAPKPAYHDPALSQLANARAARPADAHAGLRREYLPPGVVAAPSSALTLLDTARDVVAGALAVEPDTADGDEATALATQSAQEQTRSALDLGVLTASEWTDLILGFTSPTLDAKPSGSSSASPAVAEVAREIEDRQTARLQRATRPGARPVPLSNVEKGRLALLRERADLALDALETSWRAGAAVDKKVVRRVGAFLVEGAHVDGVDRLLAFAKTKLKWKVSAQLEALQVDVHLAQPDLPKAITALHALEDAGVIVPEPTYHAVIRPLVHSREPSRRAAGWNLFGHMRLVAHGAPSLALYADMLRACAHPTHPEPERALDLWTEMTVDRAILPDVHAFDACMLACARVGRFYPEALRLLRQLLDLYQTTPAGTPQKLQYTPTRETFEALLDGARRNGDLARARWLLTELIRFANHPGLADDGREVGPTAHTLAFVLETYGSASAKISNRMLRLAPSGEDAAGAAGPESETAVEAAPEDTETLDHEQMTDKMRALGFADADAVQSGDGVVVEGTLATQLATSDDPSSSSSSERGPDVEGRADGPAQPPPNVATAPLPQSSAEILHEAGLLFRHALHDGALYEAGGRAPSGGLPPLRFVKPSAQLVNGYLAVHYRHDSLAGSIAAFKTVFDEAGLRPSAHSWRFFLERLGRAEPHERELAANEAFALFKQWEELEGRAKRRFDLLLRVEGPDVAMSFYDGIGYTPETIRRVFAAMIKIMSCADQLDLARSLVERFVELYPPADIVACVPEPLPVKALVTLVPRVNVRPDALPPHLLFADVQALHARYTTYQQGKALAYLKWVTHSYGRALAQYREARMSEGADGAARAKEMVYAKAEAAKHRESYGPSRPIARRLRSRQRTLDDFEGVMPDLPPGVGKKSADLKRRHTYGDKAVGTYHRALKQRW